MDLLLTQFCERYFCDSFSFYYHGGGAYPEKVKDGLAQWYKNHVEQKFSVVDLSAKKLAIQDLVGSVR